MSDELDIENMTDDELRAEVEDMGENRVRKVCQQLVVYYIRKIEDVLPGPHRITETLFEHEAEVRLNTITDRVAIKIRQLEAEGKVKEAFLALKDLTEPLADFFENVRVMAEDEAVKRNRILLLSKVRDTYYMLADFSFL